MTNSVKEALVTALARAGVKDIPTEQWAKDDPAHAAMEHRSPIKKLFQTTNNVSRVTFEYVRDNPGVTMKKVVEDLTKQGYKKGSVGSLISQMVRVKMLECADGRYVALVSEYKSIPNQIRRLKTGTRAETNRASLIKANAARMANAARRREEREQAKKGHGFSLEVPHKAVLVKSDDVVEKLLSSLSVKDAHAVYMALRTMFEGERK